MATIFLGSSRGSTTTAFRSATSSLVLDRAWIHSTNGLRRPSASEHQDLENWTQQVQAQNTRMHDSVDLNKARQLALCLPHDIHGARESKDVRKHTAESVLKFRTKDVAPLGSELVLFNPLLSEHTLGSDGTERTFGPPGGLDQRMWASGSFQFEDGNELNIGDQIECQVEVEKVEPKSGVKTGNMVLVTRKLVYSNHKGPVSTERRCHIYRKSKPMSERKSLAAPSVGVKGPTGSRVEQEPADFAWNYFASRATLFRYSAATFNAHRIHLDPEYCRNVEGHPDCLVHGPLTATLLMNLIQTEAARKLKSFEYRATAPITVEQTISLCGKWTSEDRKTGQLWALNEAGTVCMKAKASLY